MGSCKGRPWFMPQINRFILADKMFVMIHNGLIELRTKNWVFFSFINTNYNVYNIIMTVEEFHGEACKIQYVLTTE